MAKGKSPAFQFYPGDWLRDTALRACSVGARGLWIDMICIMHQGEPYGHLTVKGNKIDAASLGRLVGCSAREATAWLKELESAQVFSRNEGDTIYSRRMVHDEEVRRARAAGGQLGGNPALKDKHKVRQKDNHAPTIDLTPSSSSSSSTFSNPPYPLEGFSTAFQIAWDAYPALKRTKRETAQAAWRDAVVRLAFNFDGDHRKAEDWLHLRVLEFTRSPLAESKFCPGIANFLIDGRYDDAPESWQRDPENGASAPPSKPPEVPHHIPKAKFT